MSLARAKVNLWLNVVGRRADGFHLLDSLIAFTDLADEIEVAPASTLSLEVVGPEAAALDGDSDNLVLKAARLLAGCAGLAPRAALRLTKRIPVAAGLGGGSADAVHSGRAGRQQALPRQPGEAQTWVSVVLCWQGFANTKVAVCLHAGLKQFVQAQMP